MPCYSPIPAYRSESGAVVFSERRSGGSVESLELPCGQCIGCRLERSRSWAVRCMHEAQVHASNWFATLTYADAPLSLDYRHCQLWLKRLRKRFGPVRFFLGGEYGEQFGRPHYHVLLFGLTLSDCVPCRLLGRSDLWRSAEMDALWGHGSVVLGRVTFESAAYVARYCLKKVNGDLASKHYEYADPETGEVKQRVPEFGRMSLKPGIGARWIERYASDVYPNGRVVARGVEQAAPRYYDKWFSKADPEGSEWLAYERYIEGLSRVADRTPERLAVQEACAKARVRFFNPGR